MRNTTLSSTARRHIVRTAALVAAIGCCLVACGTDSPATEPLVIHTSEVCNVKEDCKMEPGRFCRDEHTAVRYDEATCGADHRCAWNRAEDNCGLGCHEGYCVSAAIK